MGKKRYLYHVTKPENVGDILKFGLMRSKGGRTTFAVYLSQNPLSWYQPGLDILRVDMSGLKPTQPATTFLPDSDEILYWGDIPAWKSTKDGWKPRIQLVTDKFIRNHFRDVTKMICTTTKPR